MEDIVKKFPFKNQVIITTLAILIAVAGYLNYSENNVKDITLRAKKNSKTVSDSRAVNEQVSKNPEETQQESQEVQKEELSVPSEEADDEAVTETGDNYEPGTAILTNTGAFSANARLSREQLRAKNKETLMNMLNNGNLSEEQKADVSKEMIHMTETAELENEVETLLEAKGFHDVVVSVNEKNVDVVVNLTDVDDKQRAQIEDIVKRKTGFNASSIVITPITTEN